MTIQILPDDLTYLKHSRVRIAKDATAHMKVSNVLEAIDACACIAAFISRTMKAWSAEWPAYPLDEKRITYLRQTSLLSVGQLRGILETWHRHTWHIKTEEIQECHETLVSAISRFLAEIKP